MLNLRFKLAVTATAALMSLSTPAFAVCDGCVVGAIQAQTVTIGGLITAQTLLLRQGLGAVVVAVRGNAQTISVAVAKGAKLVATKNTETAFDIKKNEAAYRWQLPEDDCAIAAPTVGGAQAFHNPGGGAVGGGRGTSVSGGASSDMLTAINSANGTIPPKSPEIQSSIAIKGACASYAAGSVRVNDCDLSGYVGSNSQGLPNADLRAETLIDGPQESEAQTIRRLTIAENSKESTAIAAFMRNNNTPVQLGQLSKSEMSSQPGRQFLSFWDSYVARMSLAEKPMRTMKAHRIADRGLIDTVQGLVASQEAGPFVQQYLTDNIKGVNWQSAGISADELMNIEVLRRYGNPEWVVGLAKQSPEAVAKEHVLMEAVQNMLLWRMVQAVELNSVVTGQAAAQGIRTEMVPQLNALHRAASTK